ncbi:MAG: RluA family pseudouridine synthase [Candidatus Eisenbacteria bacterium]|uniref:Pseudouridine synthase n=1 Tax=Eiseniibacteriota bacterium TaxID=2212470 RepID=A0A956LY67_UNCEI|nr:RluA family pseudouridine synthase [Candidatus Eisenbacteria bacterium]
MEERAFSVDPEQAGERLDLFVSGRFPDRSRSQIQRWIREERIRVDGIVRPARHRVEAGETVLVSVPAPESPTLAPLDIPLPIVYEDEALGVVDKPSGLQVHPGAGPARPTLVQALLAQWPGWEAPGPPERPGVVHRLDRETSGLLVVAKTAHAYLNLSRQIRERQVKRRYLALVWGSPDGPEGVVDAPLGRDPRDRRRIAVRRDGRFARTHWRVLRRFEHFTVVELVLETGRTHQIRVHCELLGHPVVGDPTYGHDATWLERVPQPERPLARAVSSRLKRQALHAYHLAFKHPSDDSPCRFESPLPADMDAVVGRLWKQEGTG